MNSQRIAVITDSGTDTPADFAAAHDVRVVPLRINFSDGSTFESGVDITSRELVRRLSEEVPTTSLPSPLRIREAFEQAQRSGYSGAVFVSISSRLSATCETVRMVARQMEDFPVAVVDTRSIGAAAGLVVMEAARKIEKGLPFELLEHALEEASRKTKVFFSVQSLDLLHRGGRISDAVFRVGSVLNIKPVMTCDEEGAYTVAKKARGWDRAIEAEVKLAEAAAAGFEHVRVAMCSFEDDEVLDRLEAALRQRIGGIVGVTRSGVSPDLLVHTGPSLVGVAIQGC